MPRTTRTTTTQYAKLAEIIGGEQLDDLRNVFMLIEYPAQEEALEAAIAAETNRHGVADMGPEDAEHTRRMAILNVGYRLGLAMAQQLAGGER
jgi:hypothetical protein